MSTKGWESERIATYEEVVRIATTALEERDKRWIGWCVVWGVAGFVVGVGLAAILTWLA
jgi:hypothetical protein